MKDNSRYKKGILAENLAMILLFFKGYEILSNRFGAGQKGRNGEIDLIARKNKTICFIEVKFRKTYNDSAYSITQNQKQRIRNSANVFLRQNSKYRGYNYRFDAYLFSYTNLPKHLKNVF